MADYLKKGGRLVLFAEGRITDTGTLLKLYDGIGFLIAKTQTKIVTAYLRGADRLICSRNPGKRFWFPTVTAHFSKLLAPASQPGGAMPIRRARLTRWVRAEMERLQFETECAFGAQTLSSAIGETARGRPDFLVLDDYRLKPLSYRRLWVASELLSHQMVFLEEHATDAVGVLLPNMSAMPVTLLALWLKGKSPAIFNYSSGISAVLSGARQAGVRVIVTSQSFMERLGWDAQVFCDAGLQVVFIESLQRSIKPFQRWAAAFRFIVGRLRNPPSGITPKSTAIILFTSGSEGSPKAVPLSHRNLLSNIRQMLAVTDLHDRDRIFNALPLFHSFGLTVGTLLGLVRGSFVFLYPSPLHYRVIPNAVYETNATVFLSTNTFLNGYAKRANPYDFRTVRYVFAGAEKIQGSTFETWSGNFGVRLLEGYGATECSPAVSVNVPLGMKKGSAGRLLPGIEWRLEPVPGVLGGGRLWVRGPNVMRGYLSESEPVGRGLDHAGWYDTGDLARVDEEGFVFLLGRMKRFAKVSGEMVSLTAVEDALAGALPRLGPAAGIAVLARPDAGKGEALVVVSASRTITREEIRLLLRERGLPNLWIPAEVFMVERMPMLATGKIHYRALQEMVFENCKNLMSRET